MKNLLRTTRESKNILVKDLAHQLGVDASIISRFESGERKPTKVQLLKIAEILEIDARELLIEWMSEAIINEYGYDDIMLEALKVAESKVEYLTKNIPENSNELAEVLNEIERWKAKIDKLRQFDSYRIAQALELEYTFESNRIEGNTMTLRGTDLVVNEGITISGKSMREHLELINHKDAIDYLKRNFDPGAFYYVTYTKTSKDGKVYVGRTSGFGDPASTVKKRDATHHIKGYGPAILSTAAQSAAPLGFATRINDAAYWAIRGSEQLQIEHYRKMGISGNSMNGISPLNANLIKFLDWGSKLIK